MTILFSNIIYNASSSFYFFHIPDCFISLYLNWKIFCWLHVSHTLYGIRYVLLYTQSTKAVPPNMLAKIAVKMIAYIEKFCKCTKNQTWICTVFANNTTPNHRLLFYTIIVCQGICCCNVLLLRYSSSKVIHTLMVYLLAYRFIVTFKVYIYTYVSMNPHFKCKCSYNLI